MAQGDAGRKGKPSKGEQLLEGTVPAWQEEQECPRSVAKEAAASKATSGISQQSSSLFRWVLD